MIKLVLSIAMLGIPSSTIAQQTPFKLILSANQNTVVIDYPTAARCQKALEAINAENDQRTRSAQQRQSQLQAGIVLPNYINGFCIPG